MFIEYFTLTMIGLSILTSVGGAAFLAYNKVSGWGWFLFIAVILASGLNIHIGG